MVLSVLKWNIHPDKVQAYNDWVKSAITRTISVPGLIEFMAYRPVTGDHQIVATYLFSDLATWASWRSNEEIGKVLDELHTLATDITVEVWGPSPVVPKPIRPGG